MDSKIQLHFSKLWIKNAEGNGFLLGLIRNLNLKAKSRDRAKEKFKGIVFQVLQLSCSRNSESVPRCTV